MALYSSSGIIHASGSPENCSFKTPWNPILIDVNVVKIPLFLCLFISLFGEAI